MSLSAGAPGSPRLEGRRGRSAPSSSGLQARPTASAAEPGGQPRSGRRSLLSGLLISHLTVFEDRH